ncbi:MUM1 protein, partial [Baryphthengus martii]|nr:MUM1 protein [Baryphthengus martii]
QRSDSREAVEELKYRRSLKIALDILAQNGSAGRGPPLEGPNTRLSRENNVGSPSSNPLGRYRSIPKEKSEPETSKKKRGEKPNPGLKSDPKNQTQEGSLVLEGYGTDPSECGSGDRGDAASSGSQNGPRAESKSLPRQEKTKERLSTKSNPGNKISLKPKEGKSKRGRLRPRGAGSAGPCGSDPPTERAQPLAEEGAPPPVPGTSDAAAPVRRRPRRTFPDSSWKNASEDLGKSTSPESKDLAKRFNGRKKPESLKRVNGEDDSGGTVSPERKRKRRSCLEPSSGPSERGTLPENLPSLREGTRGDELTNLPPNLGRPPQAIEEGILVWCKLRRYPYWPAVVKNVKRKHRKACVLLIDGTTNEKKKGYTFSVPLKNLKHFDCEEKQNLIERAKEDYRQEIEWCIRLISDYRIRVGCHSFTGSFLEYFAADISYPVRKEGYRGPVQMTFPKEAEENVAESPSETSPPKPPKKLLPDRSRAARDRANKKIVEFIVKTKGAEEHLLAILKSRKQSRWLKEFLNSSQYVTCVETYLEDEEQLDLVVNYLKEVYHGIDAKNLRRIGGDGIKLISDVLLPEAIIYAISAVDDIDYKKAEEKYIKGPSVSKR